MTFDDKVEQASDADEVLALDAALDGVVYLAERDDLDARVAIKVLRDALLSPAKARTVRAGGAAAGKPQPSRHRSVPRRQWKDLDMLCLTAMHGDPQRRYQTVEALIRHIDHYMGDRPLDARPDSLRYLTGKFLYRMTPWSSLRPDAPAPDSVNARRPARGAGRRSRWRRLRASGRCVRRSPR